MKRVAIFILFIFLIFISQQYIVLPLLFIVAILSPFIFYEILFLGLLLDIVLLPVLPLYTISTMIILGLSFIIRKRMSLHV